MEMSMHQQGPFHRAQGEESSVYERAFVFVPENEFDIPEGRYTRRALAELLRYHRGDPPVVYFLAQMVEEQA